MDSAPSKPNGPDLWKKKLKTVKKPALTLSALLVLCLPTAACFEATRTTVTATGGSYRATEQQARCSGWRKITFDAENDTIDTIQQVRVHNRTGRNKRCWK